MAGDTRAEVEKLLGPQDVADWFGVPLATVYRWSSRREGPRSMRVGKHLRFSRSDCEAWLEARAS